MPSGLLHRLWDTIMLGENRGAVINKVNERPLVAFRDVLDEVDNTHRDLPRDGRIVTLVFGEDSCFVATVYSR